MSSELLTVSYEHIANMAFLSPFEKRCYILEHGLTADGKHYDRHSGTLTSSLERHQVPVVYNDDDHQRKDPLMWRGPRKVDLSAPLDKLLTVTEFNTILTLPLYESARDVARFMGGKSRTVVSNTLKNIYDKLQMPVHTRGALVARYTKEWLAGCYPDLPCPITITRRPELERIYQDLLGIIELQDKDIAPQLKITIRTVKARVRRLKTLLGMEVRAALTAYRELVNAGYTEEAECITKCCQCVGARESLLVLNKCSEKKIRFTTQLMILSTEYQFKSLKIDS